jgi:acyl-CoA synthetase (AMP-forming)/AMP-acid ligase II/thioredoxin reductase/acyl carrier protein
MAFPPLFPNGQRPDFVGAFHATAARCRDLEAYRFLGDDGQPAVAWTLGEMDARARAIAAHLQRIGATGERALLVFDPGLEFVAAFVGCLYAGVTAVPAYPPDPMRMQRTLPRLQKIVADAEARWMLSTRSHMAWAGTLCTEAADLTLVASEEIDTRDADQWEQQRFAGDHLALMQYTSGSTGEPKGVMVTHDNLLSNLAQIHAKIDFEDALVVSWLPPYHDMGLVGGVLQAWYSARRAVLMSPLAFFQHPYRWLKAIDDYRATTTVAPNFAFDLCVRKITAEERSTLDLSHLRLAMNGSEPVRPSTIDAFVDAFGDCGVRRDIFYPCYGMAETTLMVTGPAKQTEPNVADFVASDLERGVATRAADAGSAADAENRRRLVAAGSGVSEQTLRVVDPATGDALGDGRVGEIWVAGPHIARGYWNQPKATAAAFAAMTSEGEGPFLRTGDLGFVSDGDLFITGRAKDVIIVLGRNHYPQDIEQTVERCNAALKANGGAAFSIDVRDQERVVVVHEVMRPGKLDLDEVMATIRREVAAEHQLPLDAVVLIKPGGLPKTTSGKVQRSACRQAYAAGELREVAQWRAPRDRDGRPDVSGQYVAPQTETEILLAAAWADVLGLERVGAQDNFFDLGGHSLLATQLITRLGPRLNVDLPLETLFELPTVAALAGFIDQQREASDQGTLAAMLERLENMSEQEAQHMISHGSSANGSDDATQMEQTNGAAGKVHEHEYLIIGAGPAGLQAGYDFQKAGRDYLIVEGAPAAGAFFQVYPRHRMLISINKVYTGFDDPEVNLRWDWNSLLSDPADGAPLLKDISREYFPAADDLVKYLGEFAKFYDLNIKYNTRIKRITKDDRFELVDEKGDIYRCKVLVVATGCAKANVPDFPGAELTENYTEMNVDPDDYLGQRVLILGKGNSAFETADNLIGTTELIHLASPDPIKMAWKTHFVGHLRAVNNNFLDTYLLKSQNALLDGNIVKLERRDGKIVATMGYAHACGEVEELVYDRVLCCTGFSFDDSMFDESCKPELSINDRFPTQTEEWESTNVPDLYFAGTLMQMRDFKKKQSGFIHGFRYNVKLLNRILEHKRHGVVLEHEKMPRCAEAITKRFIARGDGNSALWQQTGYMCDLLVDRGGDEVQYYRDLSLDYVHENWLGQNGTYYTMTMEFGQDRIDAAKDVFSVPRVHKDDVERADESTGIHPIVRRFCRGKMVAEHHVIEDIASEFHESVHHDPLLAFFQKQLDAEPEMSEMEPAS